jgi:hypothetical protein
MGIDRRARTEDEETLPHLTLGARLSRPVLDRPSAVTTATVCV